jgi:hypothetical protein
MNNSLLYSGYWYPREQVVYIAQDYDEYREIRNYELFRELSLFLVVIFLIALFYSCRKWFF